MEAEAQIEERKTGIESPNYRGLSRLACRDYKEKRDGGRVQNSPVHSRSCGINVCTCSVLKIHRRGEILGPKLDCARKLDIVH